MQTTADDGQTLLLERIRTDLRWIEARSRELRRLDVRLVSASLGFSALATLLAGLTAAVGPLAGEGPPAWRWTCGLLAAVTAVSGVLTGAHQRFRVPERRAQVLAVEGRLRGLEIALGVARREPREVAREYQELLGQYPDLRG